MDTIVSIKDLTFEYIREEDQVRIRAIDDVSACIEKGSFTAVIGKNGSGKSTLAKNINALLIPTEGEVIVNGMDTRDPELTWEIRQNAGMVFQNPDNQLVSAVVEDDVAFGPENLGVEPEMIRKRVEDSLKSVGMYEFRKREPHLLSGGQKQRIAIAGVIAMCPQCIVFDEPTAMLDPRGRQEIMKIIKELNQGGITVILITHFMEEAVQADRIIVMDKGSFIMDGTPEEIFLNDDTLKELELAVPLPVELARKLRDKGMDIPFEIIDAEGLIEHLCQYR